MTMITRDTLIGTWSLLRWRYIAPDGREDAPHGEGNLGRIVYHPSGHMAAFLMHPDWPATGRPDHGSVAYSGRFELHGDRVHHLVDLATTPYLIGQRLVRQLRYDGDILWLEATDNPERIDRLEWRRTPERE